MSSTICDVAQRPYPGLRPFEAYEADIFFGRNRHVTDLLKRLKSERFLSVVGPSGCGKSSLIRAGLIPALEAGFMARSQCSWNFAVLRPGNQPLLNLAQALCQSGVFGESECEQPSTAEQMKEDLEASSRSLANRLLLNEHAQGTNLLILVDQFEELFRFEQHGGGDESRAFVNLLLETAGDPNISAYVVITMRTDFLGECPRFAGLPEAINSGQYLTPRLTREQIEPAIVGPARMFDGEVEADVVARILNEMGTDPDQLPLMQHLLMRMWRSAMQRAGLETDDSVAKVLSGEIPAVARGITHLTMEDYKRSGGLRNALGQHAQDVFDRRLDARQQTLAEQMFRRLTDVAPNGQLVRRSPPPKFTELCEALAVDNPDQLREVIDTFRVEGRSFLMPPVRERLMPETPIDIAHESLIRNWPLLQQWTQDESQASQIRDDITEDALRWDKGGRNLSDTSIPESRLGSALEWARRRPRDVTLVVRDFLKACQQQKRQVATARVRLRLIQIIAVFTAIAAVLLGAMTLALRTQEQKTAHALASSLIEQKKAAEAIHDLSIQEQKTARALAGRFWHDAVQLLDKEGQGQYIAAAILWAAEAYDRDSKSASMEPERSELYAVRVDALVAQHPRLQQVWSHPSDSIQAISSKREFVLTTDVSNSDNLQLWDSTDYTGTHSLSSQSNAVPRPTGKPLYTSSRVWATEFLPNVESARPAVVAIVEEEDRERKPNVLKLWRSVDVPAEEFKIIQTQATPPTDNADELNTSITPTLAVSPDGKRIATCGNLYNGACQGLCVWDVEKRELIPWDDAATAAVVTAAFGSTGKWLATLDRDGRAALWDLALGEPIFAWDAHVGKGQKVIFSPDEQLVLTVGGDNFARLWKVPSTSESEGVERSRDRSPPKLDGAFAHESEIFDVAFSPDGNLVATAGRDRIVRVWNTNTGQLALPPLYHVSAVGKVLFIDRQTLLTDTAYNSQIWRLTTSNPPPTRLDIAGATIRVDANKRGNAYSPNGRYFVTANTIEERICLQMWDVSRSPRRRGKPLFHDGAGSISYVAVSDDGRRVLAVVDGRQGTSQQQSGYLWNVDDQTKQELWTKQPSKQCCAAFSADAKLLLLARQPSTTDSASQPWALQVWSDDAKLIFRCSGEQPGPVNHIAWNAMGDRAVVCSGNTIDQKEKLGAAQLWRWDGERSHLDADHVWKHKPDDSEVTSNAVIFAAFSRDGAHVATGGVDDAAYLWDVSAKSNEPFAGALKHTSDVVHVAFSRDGGLLATSSVADKKTCVWNVDAIHRLARGAPAMAKFTLVHNGAVNHAAFSADGKWLATASSDKMARVWSLAYGELAAQFRTGGNVREACFSEDGKRLITVSDGEVDASKSRGSEAAWSTCSTWVINSQPRSFLEHLQGYARLLSASELNEDQTFMQTLSSIKPQAGPAAPTMLASSQAYFELWQKYGKVLFPDSDEGTNGGAAASAAADR